MGTPRQCINGMQYFRCNMICLNHTHSTHKTSDRHVCRRNVQVAAHRCGARSMCRIICVYIYVSHEIRVSVYMYTNMCISIYVRIYVYLFAYMYAYIYIYITRAAMYRHFFFISQKLCILAGLQTHTRTTQSLHGFFPSHPDFSPPSPSWLLLTLHPHPLNYHVFLSWGNKGPTAFFELSCNLGYGILENTYIYININIYMCICIYRERGPLNAINSKLSAFVKLSYILNYRIIWQRQTTLHV